MPSCISARWRGTMRRIFLPLASRAEVDGAPALQRLLFFFEICHAFAGHTSITPLPRIIAMAASRGLTWHTWPSHIARPPRRFRIRPVSAWPQRSPPLERQPMAAEMKIFSQDILCVIGKIATDAPPRIKRTPRTISPTSPRSSYSLYKH